MIGSARRRLGSESGVTLVLVAMILVVLLGSAALAIDVGSFYQAQRQAQAAADAGALAGAQDLLGTSTAWSAQATTYAQTNAPSPTATISATQPTGASVKVTVSASTPAFFGRIFGLTSARVSATAVASALNKPSSCSTPGAQCDAIFAKSTSCPSPPNATVQVSTGGETINGVVHSNGSFDSSGGSNTFGPTEYGSQCTAPSTNGNQTFASGPTAMAPLADWPIDYSLQYPSCTTTCTGQSAASAAGVTGPLTGTPPYCTQSAISFVNITPLTGQVYCAVGTGIGVDPSKPSTWTGTISLNTAGTSSAPILSTYIGGSISVPSTAGAYFGPCVTAPCSSTNKLLFYATTGNISVIGGTGGGEVDGDMFAPAPTPAGSISIKGGGHTTNFLEGQTVSVQGGNMTGDGPQDVPGTIYIGQTVSLSQ